MIKQAYSTTNFPFPDAWRVDNLVFISGQVSVTAEGEVLGYGDIEVQTRTTYENLQRILDKAGCTFKDLVKLNTYLVFDGSNEEFSEFWATMARVRQEFIPEPGPTATAMRVAGLSMPGLLIEIDGVAVLPEQTSGNL